MQHDYLKPSKTASALRKDLYLQKQSLMPVIPKKRGRPSKLDLDLRKQTAKFFPGVIGVSPDDSPIDERQEIAPVMDLQQIIEKEDDDIIMGSDQEVQDDKGGNGADGGLFGAITTGGADVQVEAALEDDHETD